MLTKRIPLYYLLLAVLLGVAIAFVFFKFAFQITAAGASSPVSKNKTIAAGAENTSADCNVKSVRLGGFSYVNPLLYSDRECESEDLFGIKQEITNYIESEKSKGTLSTASVYLRVPGKGQWMAINADEMYHPASLNKVPIIITYMHMSENYNHLLDQKLFFAKHDPTLPVQTFTSKTLAPGKNYTLGELLHAMIAYSDNDATLLLLQHINLEYYNKTFTDLSLPKPSFEFDKFFISARQYSLFFRVLYNASYLSDASSEYAMSLLAQCNFKDGLLKKLPADVKAVHKFGESGYENVRELHESAIIYLNNNPYLITVMTRGKDQKELSEILSNISEMVYNKFRTNS